MCPLAVVDSVLDERPIRAPVSDAGGCTVAHTGGVGPLVEDDGLGDGEPAAVALRDRAGLLSDRAADGHEPVMPVETHVDALRVPCLRGARAEADGDGAR